VVRALLPEPGPDQILDWHAVGVSKTGRPIEVDNLVTHLKALQREVQDLDQEGDDDDDEFITRMGLIRS
jgi:hypothetical protein